MFSIDSFIGHASHAPFTVPHMNPFISAMVFVNAEVLCNHTLAQRGHSADTARTSVRRRARSSAFRPVVVYDGACWKDRMVATDSPSAAEANRKKATRNRRSDKSWSESHRNGKMMRR